MKVKYLIAVLFAASIYTNISAAPTPKPPPEPQDVNVVNTPSVTVTNPQTSVTVDNTTPIPVNVQGAVTVSAEPQFVGFSNDSVNGNVGLVGMHGACASTYGAGARMCLDIEVVKTPGLQAIPSVPSGWIQPTGDFLYPTDKIFDLTCANWTTAAPLTSAIVLNGQHMQIYQGELTYPPYGGQPIVEDAECIHIRPVACCQ